MSIRSEAKSVNSKGSQSKSVDSDASEDDGPLPLANTMFVFSKLLMFMGISVIVLGGIVYTYFKNSHNNGMFGGLLMFICGLIARYTDFKVLAIINCVFAFISAVVSFYFWVETIREYQSVSTYSMCVDNSYSTSTGSNLLLGPYIAACQAAHQDADCYCVDKHGTFCIDYILNRDTMTSNCHSIISVYRWEVAGVVAALTIGTGLLILYFFLVVCSLCYQAIIKWKMPRCIRYCYDFCFPPPKPPPEPLPDVPEEVERKQNHMMSRMLQDAADNVYNHEKDIELAAETKTLPRKVVWEDEVPVAAPETLTPRREARYVEQYVKQKYPHLGTPSPPQPVSRKPSVVKRATPVVPLLDLSHIKKGRTVANPAGNNVDINGNTSPDKYNIGNDNPAVRRKPSSSVKSGSTESHKWSNTVVPVAEDTPEAQQQQQQQRSGLPSIKNKPPPVSVGINPASMIVMKGNNLEDTSSDEELEGEEDDSVLFSDSTKDRPIVNYSDDEYERPPRLGEGRFDYLDDYLDAKVALRIAAYQQDLMADPELEDHSFSLQAVPEDAPQSHTLDDVKSHDLSTLQEDSTWIGGGDVGDHSLLGYQPHHHLHHQQQQQQQQQPLLAVERDPLEGQILVPLQDTRAEDVVKDRPPYMIFTHLPPLSQLTPEVRDGGVPREKRTYIQNQQYKQQMYLYQHY